MRKYTTVLLLCLALPEILFAQATSSTNNDGFQEFKEFQYREMMDESDRVSMEFAQKTRKLLLLTTTRTPISFSADHQQYLQLKHLYLLDGNVQILKDELSLLADHVEINDFTSDLVAEGNVFIRFEEDEITCRRFEYNFEGHTGRMFDCSGTLKPDVHFQCKLLERLPEYTETGKSQYYLQHAVITSCEGESPDWKLKSPRALARVDHYLHLTHPTFWIKNIPILYSPYWVHPIKTEKCTGFMIPTVGFNSVHGPIIVNEFYWVLADNADATFGLDYYTYTGLREDWEFRYGFSPYSHGKIFGKHRTEWESARSDRNPEDYWMNTVQQVQILPGNIRQSFNAYYISDKDYDLDYNVRGVTRYVNADLQFTRYWGLYGLTLDTVYFKDLDENVQDELQRIPRLEFSSGRQKIGRTDIRWKMKATLENILRSGKVTETYNREDPDGAIVDTITVTDFFEKQVGRFHTEPEISYIFAEVPWFSIEPRLGYYFSWWDMRKEINPHFLGGTWATNAEEESTPQQEGPMRGTGGSGEEIYRYLYTTGAHYEGPRFYRIFETDWGKILKLKHLVYPEIDFTLIPEVDQSDIMNLDSIDRIDAKKALYYGITQKLIGKIEQQDFKTQYGEDAHYRQSEWEEGSRAPGGAPQKLGGLDGMPPLVPTPSPPAGEETGSPTPTSTPKTTIREIASLTFGQIYDFQKEDWWAVKQREYEANPNDPRYTEPGRNDLPAGDVFMRAVISPFQDYYAETSIFVDPYENKVSQAYSSLYFQPRNWFLRLNWNLRRDLYNDPPVHQHSISIEGLFNLWQHWGTEINLGTDLQTHRTDYLLWKLTYKAQCWSVTWHTFYKQKVDSGIYPDWILEDEFQFGISFTLRNVGEIGHLNLGDVW